MADEDSPDQSAAETARLQRQNSTLSNYTNTFGNRGLAGDDNTGQRDSARNNPLTSSGGSGEARPNPLDDYANYTYGIIMYAAAAADYQPGAVNGQVMVASGGTARDNRLPQFYEDFYFENLKFESVIGVNSKSRNSNVITFEFTVIEPFGISLMDRLLAVAQDLDAKNWQEMVFTLQVDFFANSDDGEPINPVPNQTKYFQTKLIGCDIKASSKGSEYKFTAIPYGHIAYTQTFGSMPSNFEGIGHQIKDLFADGAEGSFAKYLNDHQKSLAKDKKFQDEADVYKFVIDGDIESAYITSTGKQNNIRSTAMPSSETPKKQSDAKSARDSGKLLPIDLIRQRVAVNAGTSIIDAINLVIKNSTFVSSQIKDGKEGALNWYKIIAVVENGNYDKKRNTHQKTITYHVKSYQLYNTKYPNAPMGLPDKWEKEYNYIFTGQNQQIIDFNIDFNTMFYTMLTTHKEKFGKTETKVDNAEATDEKDKKSEDPKGTDGSLTPSRVQPVVAIASEHTSYQGDNDKYNIAANDLYKSLMSTSRGDMLNIKLKIAGDPEFVKQDDVFYGPDGGSGESIDMDSGEVYIKIFFKSPTDMMQDTGLMDFSSYPQAVFSGLYRVLRVESLFERGQFTQTLDAVRLFGQDGASFGSGSGGMSDSNNQRQATTELGDARGQAQDRAIEEQIRSMTGSTPYPSDAQERAKIRELEDEVRRNPPPAYISPEEIENENKRLLNRSLNKSTPAQTVNNDNLSNFFRDPFSIPGS